MKAVRVRVDRLAANVKRRTDGLDPQELVDRLQATRRRGPMRRTPTLMHDELRAKGRKLRANLVRAGILRRL